MKFPENPIPRERCGYQGNSGLSHPGWFTLGDSGVDMLTAVGAGMLPVGSSLGFRTGDELRENGAEHLIETPMDLLSIIDL